MQESDRIAPDHEAFVWWLGQPPISHLKLAALRPNFLIISPPKTGSSWLAAKLGRHPAVFIPGIKEIKYFSSYCKWLDLNWYLDHFAAAGPCLKGEASPSYAILPIQRIRLIRRLMPDVKLIFLMRDPVARAWSHAKHNLRYQEANFASCTATFEEVANNQWLENFTHEWPLASGDYLGQLQRWLTVFPREQMYVGFYESIATAPQTLLQNVFAFLGVSPDVDFSAFHVEEKVLIGLPGHCSPALQDFLRRMLGGRTRLLASFLLEHLRLSLPSEWEGSLSAATNEQFPATIQVFNHELKDHSLLRVLAHEETFPSSPRLVVQGYRGYNLVYYRERFHALALSLGPVRLDEATEAELQRYQERGACHIASSLSELRELVDEYVIRRLEAKLSVVESMEFNLRGVREYVCRLEADLDRAINELHQVREQLGKLQVGAQPVRPLFTRLFRPFWKAGRHLGSFVRSKWTALITALKFRGRPDT